MNQHSPGQRPANDDLEMLAIQQNSLQLENGDLDALLDDEHADANQALLRPRRSNPRGPRYLEGKGAFVDTWRQVKGLCVEVRFLEFVKGQPCSVSNGLNPERTYASYDHGQFTFHRKTIR